MMKKVTDFQYEQLELMYDNFISCIELLDENTNPEPILDASYKLGYLSGSVEHGLKVLHDIILGRNNNE